MLVMLSPSVSTPDKLKSLLDRGGNRTCDLWFASPTLFQLSCVQYEIKSVRVGDISEHSLVPLISACYFESQYNSYIDECEKYRKVEETLQIGCIRVTSQISNTI